MQIFNNNLKKFKDHPFQPLVRQAIESMEDKVELEIPKHNIEQYKILPAMLPPTVYIL